MANERRWNYTLETQLLVGGLVLHISFWFSYPVFNIVADSQWSSWVNFKFSQFGAKTHTTFLSWRLSEGKTVTCGNESLQINRSLMTQSWHGLSGSKSCQKALEDFPDFDLSWCWSGKKTNTMAAPVCKLHCIHSSAAPLHRCAKKKVEQESLNKV